MTRRDDTMRISLAITVAASLVGSSLRAADDAHRFVLTDSATNRHSPSFRVTSGDLGISGPKWSVTSETLHGGKQEGVELITIDNGAMTIRVIPTRGMGILDVQAGDVRLGWDSPVKEVVHPKHVRLESRGGLGWLDGFNEWMVRCGLEYAGHPGKDQFTTNTGATAEMDLSLHGKIGNIPASRVEVIIDKAPPHRLRVRGVVHERLFFGPKLELVAEVSTEPGAATFQLSDAVTNRGAADQEFEIIYHGNYGRPILEEGAKVIVPVRRVAPMNDHASAGVRNYATYRGPTQGWVEEVYLVEPYSDQGGKTSVVLHNASGTVGTSVSWATKELPYLTIWKNTAPEADGYVTGLEPGTCYPFNRRVERKYGRLPTLGPGQTRTFTLDYAILQGKEAVGAATQRVTDIQRGRPTEFVSEAPSTE